MASWLQDMRSGPQWAFWPAFVIICPRCGQGATELVRLPDLLLIRDSPGGFRNVRVGSMLIGFHSQLHFYDFSFFFSFTLKQFFNGI